MLRVLTQLVAEAHAVASSGDVRDELGRCIARVDCLAIAGDRNLQGLVMLVGSPGRRAIRMEKGAR